MLNGSNALHVRSRFFRCVLALTLVFAFCPSSESYANDLRDKSENADLSVCENKTTSGDDVELLSDVVSNCPYDYVGVVVGEDDLVIDWEQAKLGGTSFAFVGAGEIDPDGAYIRNGNLSSNLEACMDYGIPFSLFVSGVKSHSDIVTLRYALFDQLVEYDSINVFFVLDETADVRSVLFAIADLRSDCPTISFGIGADASCFQDNASIVNQTSVQRWVNDGWADFDDGADYHQLNRVVAIPGCEGSFCVIGGNCLPSVELDTYPLEEPKGNDSEHSLAEAALCEVEEEGGSSASSPRVLADGVYEVTSAIEGAKALDIAGGSRDDGARLQLWSPNSTPAQRFRVAYDEASGFYSVENIGSGKVLDAAAGRWEDGTAVQQYASNGTAAQLWSIEPDGDGYRVCSALNRSQVLDVPGADASDGAGIQLYGANGSLAQRWSFKEVKPTEGGRTIEDGLYRINSALSDSLVVDIAGGAGDDGGNAWLYTWNSTAAQLFYVALDDEGFYSIVNVASGKALDVCGGSVDAGANVQQWTPNGTDAQKWAIRTNEDGTTSVISKLGLNLDVSGAASQAGANLQVWHQNGTLAQSFSFESASSPRVLADGVYEVTSAIEGAKALDIAGGSRDDGARLQLWSPNSTPAQRFRVAYDEASGFYSVENIGSGKVLDAAAGRWEDGTAVQQYASNGTAAQLWSIEPDGDGYRVCSALNRSQVLDVPGADASDGAGIQLYGANGSLAQRWSFKLVSCPVDFQVDYSGRKITPIDKYDGRVVVALPSSADSKSVTLRVGEKQTTPLYLGSSCVLGQGEEVSFADVGLDVSPGAELSCPVLNKEGDVVCTLVVMRSAECASIFLGSDDPQNGGRDFVESSPDHSASAKGNMLMLDEGGSTVYDGKLDQIKGRGNSTWAADKKPYQIKLKKKTDLLQSGDSSNKNKTWVLLANAYDASGVRNVVSYSLAQSIGVNSPIEFRIVDLYYDGEYRGTYLLCEKVQVNSGRVEINDLEESNDQANSGAKLLDDVEGVNSYGNPIRYTRGVASPVDITGGYLIELDGRYANERSWFSVSTPNGLAYFVCKNPEGWSYEEADYLSCFMQDAFDALNEDGINHRTGKKTEDYIDIDSFASLYWINELAKNRDGLIFSSTYCYKDADSSTGASKLIFGPAWDFDLTLGNLNDIADPANDWVVDPTGWYTRAIGIAPLFMRDPQVMRIVDDSKGAVVAATRSYLADRYLTQKRALESSMRLNSMVWGEKDETCADVEAWLTARLNWLSSF